MKNEGKCSYAEREFAQPSGVGRLRFGDDGVPLYNSNNTLCKYCRMEDESEGSLTGMVVPRCLRWEVSEEATELQAGRAVQHG